MSRPQRLSYLFVVVPFLLAGAIAISYSSPGTMRASRQNSAILNAVQKIENGEQVFRFDTFGDEAFWGDTLKLHQAIEGANLGGVGPGVSPKTALAVGLKV